MLVISCMWRLTTSVAAAGSIGCMAWKPGASLARPSSVVSGRLPSSLVSLTVLRVVSFVFLSVTSIVVSIGTISSSNLPACWPAAVRSWLCSEYSSCASRLTCHCLAICSQ